MIVGQQTMVEYEMTMGQWMMVKYETTVEQWTMMDYITMSDNGGVQKQCQIMVEYRDNGGWQWSMKRDKDKYCIS